MATQRPLVLDTANGLIRELISTDKLGGFAGGGASGEVLTYGGPIGDAASVEVNQAADTTDGTPSTYGFRLKNQGTINLSIGSDSSHAYLQSWASKPLVVNSQGNDTLLNPTSGSVLIGTAAAPTANAFHVLVLGSNGTNPTLSAGTVAIYNNGGEVYHLDASGNVTLTSPHAIDEAMAAGIDIPDSDLHPTIGKSFNVYTGHGTYTYRDQIVPFQIPDDQQQDWTESQITAALARERERFAYEVAKAIHIESGSDKPFDLMKPVDYVPSDPPQWLQRRGVMPVDKKLVSRVVSKVKAELIAKVPVMVAEKLEALKAQVAETGRKDE